jgi:hypothetical protein
MPPKLKRARDTGTAAVDSSTSAPPAKRAKTGQHAKAAVQAHSVGAANLSSRGHATIHSSAAAASSVAPSILPPNADDALKNFQRRCKQTKVSVQLAAALRARKSVLERSQSAAEQLLEDEARDDGPLIDLSHRVEGKGSLLMLLIEMLAELEVSERNNDPTVQAKQEELDSAWKAFEPVLPHICALTRSSYDTTIKRPDGEDALALLASTGIPCGTSVWSYNLAEALLDRGADVNTRFDGGATPLIAWSFGSKPSMKPGIALGPLLLLKHGADIDVRMNDGTTGAHAIAINGNHPLAEALADAGWLAAADLTLLDNDGDTALQVAQHNLAVDSASDKEGRQVICDLLRDNAALWTNVARPLIHQWLSHSLLIPDLAHVVLSLVDGKERGQ